MLTLEEVDIDFAGRHPPEDRIRRAITALQCGDPLEVVRNGERIVLHDRAGSVVGRLAAQFDVPIHKILQASVAAIVVRARADCRRGFEQWIRSEQWELVVPELTIDPNA